MSTLTTTAFGGGFGVLRLEGALIQDQFLIRTTFLAPSRSAFLHLANRTYTVASRPQVTPPVSSPKTFTLLEQAQRQFIFQVAYEY